MAPSLQVLLSLLAVMSTLPLAAQSARPAIVSGALREDGRVATAAFGLGTGGVGAPANDAAVAALERGQHWTPGGVLVRAQTGGVKLDFPSGAELLLAPDGVVHLRDGGHTGPSLHGIELWLADGARVRVRRSAGGRRWPFEMVEVAEGETSTVLWRRHHPVHERARAPKTKGDVYLVLGNGDVLYRASALGPLIALERVVQPRAAGLQTYPQWWIGIVGDVLIESLQRLPTHVPQHTVQFPHAPEAAANLAAAAPALFPRGRLARPPGAVGQLVFGLAGGFRLVLEERRDREVWLCLYRGAAGVPAVEWSTLPRTRLFLLRPTQNGGPRYFLRGIDMSSMARAAFPLPRNALNTEQALRVLRALGHRGRSVPIAIQPAAARR